MMGLKERERGEGQGRGGNVFDACIVCKNNGLKEKSGHGSFTFLSWEQGANALSRERMSRRGGYDGNKSNNCQL